MELSEWDDDDDDCPFLDSFLGGNSPGERCLWWELFGLVLTVSKLPRWELSDLGVV